MEEMREGERKKREGGREGKMEGGWEGGREGEREGGREEGREGGRGERVRPCSSLEVRQLLDQSVTLGKNDTTTVNFDSKR